MDESYFKSDTLKNVIKLGIPFIDYEVELSTKNKLHLTVYGEPWTDDSVGLGGIDHYYIDGLDDDQLLDFSEAERQEIERDYVAICDDAFQALRDELGSDN